MKYGVAMMLSALVLVLQGCALCRPDPLRTAYEEGQISSEEYQARCLERDEALARQSPAHSELLHSRLDNQSRLPPW